MVGRERHELRPEQRVVPRGEDVELAFAVGRGLRVEREAHKQTLGAADPVALHQPDLVRPALELVDRRQELLGEGRCAEEPLGQIALLDQRAGAPAAPVLHLLVGEYGLLNRIPIDLGLLAQHEAGPEEVEEELLLVLVVFGIAGRELARPVVGISHRLQLRLHGRDVLVGP